MRCWRLDEEQTHFLNVDVDVSSKVSLEPLVAPLGQRIIVYCVGPEGRYYGAHFSLAGSHGEDADRVTRRLAALVAGLPMAARKLWYQARKRDFNVGIQGGMKPSSHEVALEQETVRVVAQLGGRIVVTTYAAEIAPPGSAQHPRRRKTPPSDMARPKNPPQARNRKLRG